VIWQLMCGCTFAAAAAAAAAAARDKVHRKMQRASRDIRFDDVLANACQADRKDFCPDVQPVSSRSSGRLNTADLHLHPSRHYKRCSMRGSGEVVCDVALSLFQRCVLHRAGLVAVLLLVTLRRNLTSSSLAPHRADWCCCCCWRVQGSARVIRCLQDHRSSLSQTCAAALFDHEVRAALAAVVGIRAGYSGALLVSLWAVLLHLTPQPSDFGAGGQLLPCHLCISTHVCTHGLTYCPITALVSLQVKMAEDIDFKYPTRKACAWEISNFCKNIPHGHARVIRCLQVGG
jgi:hypothetical protein